MEKTHRIDLFINKKALVRLGKMRNDLIAISAFLSFRDSIWTEATPLHFIRLLVERVKTRPYKMIEATPLKNLESLIKSVFVKGLKLFQMMPQFQS